MSAEAAAAAAAAASGGGGGLRSRGSVTGMLSFDPQDVHGMFVFLLFSIVLVISGRVCVSNIAACVCADMKGLLLTLLREDREFREEIRSALLMSNTTRMEST